jgi:signal peptidase I
MASASTTRQVGRRLVESAALTIISIGFLQAFLLDGLVPALRVDSASMAPALLGPHFDLRCPACGFEFDADASSADVAARWRCPNCRGSSSLEDAPLRAGNRLLVNRAAYLLGQPKRGDIVVLDCPDAPGPCVKRIVGLPGETVELRGGDVWIDGVIARKSFAQWQSRRILVCDNQPAPATKTADFVWRSETGSRGDWIQTDGIWKATSSQSSADFPWLVLTGSTSGTAPAAIWDDLPYNINESRALNPAPDGSLACRVALTGGGKLMVRATAGGKSVLATYRLDDHSLLLEIDGQQVAACQIPTAENPRSFELVVVDAQVLVAADDRPLLAVELDALSKTESASPVWAISVADGASAKIEHLRVFRDVYYVPPPDHPGPWQLSEDEFFALGDNASVSKDSRHWPVGAVRRRHLQGPAVIMTPSR